MPSNHARIVKGELVFLSITQNKPKDIIHDIDTAVQRLLAGETATIDVRQAYTTELRRKLAEATGGE